MSIARLISRPCTIVRRHDTTERDGHGVPVAGEGLVETAWELQQQRTSEAVDKEDLTDTLWNAFFRVGEEIAAGDSVIDGLDEHEYVVHGDPEVIRSPFNGRLSHIEAKVARTAVSTGSGS